MNFLRPLIEGKILKRYKRFLADIELKDGTIVIAHVPNTGSMKTCWAPGWKAMISDHRGSGRKLHYTLEMVHNGSSWIGVNTGWPNKIAKEAIEKKQLPEFSNYDTVLSEQKVGDSRIDLLLKDSKGTLPDKLSDKYVEIKNVTMLGDNQTAIFPDAVSVRGQKHLRELILLKQKGFGAAMLYIVQRQDVHSFKVAHEIDPVYAALLKEAYEAGVEIVVYQCSLNPHSINIDKKLPFIKN